MTFWHPDVVWAGAAGEGELCVDFVTGAFATWLLEQLADAGRHRLAKFLLGDEQDRALRGAADAAIQLTANDFYPNDDPRADELARVIDHIFDHSVSVTPIAGHATLLQALYAGISARLAPLGDADLTGTESSSAELIGVSAVLLERKLIGHLVREIVSRGARGGPLEPLASQLNSDVTHLQGQRIERRLDQLAQAVEDLLTGFSSSLPGTPEARKIITEARRREANSWCEQVLSRTSIDFWEEDWRQLLGSILEAPQSLVLTARGGSGKSVLAAHLVRYFLQQDPDFCPVVLYRSEDLRGGPAAVRKLVGANAPDALMRYVDTMRALDHRALFVVDGLDSMLGATSTKATADILRELADTSCLLVTCRTELWDQEFSHLSIQQQQVQPLTSDIVRRVLSNHTPFTQWWLPVLRIPFFLDAALTLSRYLIELPRTETGLLRALWNTYREPPGAPMPRWYNFEPLLTRLAKLQLAAMSYEIPRLALLAELRGLDDAAEAVARLEGGGILWRQPMGTDVTVRLSHDLLDCFNMTRLLVHGDDGRRRRQQLYERAADGIGWPLLSMLVQVAHDGSDVQMLREIFAELVMTLDRKRWDDQWMARSWAATYVLRDKITHLVPLVLECLDGEQVPSLKDPATHGGSKLDPRPCVTQEAASSLASSFDALDDWRAGFPAQAIPVLRRGLERWQLRKRFVEALAKYKDPAALEALTAFARSQLRPGGDTGLLGEVAEALARIGQAFTGERRQACIDIVQDIIAYPDLESRARRIAIESKNQLTYPVGEDVPDVDEVEIIVNLSPFDEVRGSYSDWRVIQRYSDYAYQRIVDGHLSQPLLGALLRAFTHEQLFARIPVAHCLGQADDAAARAALSSELVRPSLSWDVQQACLEALDAQVRNAPGPALRALRRWLILSTAQHAARLGAPSARALAELARKFWGPTEHLVTQTALEIIPGTTTAAITSVPSIELLPQTAAAVDDWVHELVLPADYAAAGVGWETKYRMVSISSFDDAGWQVALAETTWEESASFHCAMRRQESSLQYNADRILSGWLAGEAYMPGIVSIHGIVVTQDGKVVETRRPAGTLYSPGLWSISFEEQITTADLRSETHDAATAATLRGFTEEFGLPNDRCRVRIISAIVELPIVNPVLVAVVEADENSDDFQRAFEDLKNQAKTEIDDISFIDASADLLQMETERPDLHPTATIRALLLSRILRMPENR